jgi:hypothetical protein
MLPIAICLRKLGGVRNRAEPLSKPSQRKDRDVLAWVT